MTGPAPGPATVPARLTPELEAFWASQLPTLSPRWREAVLRHLALRYGQEAVRGLHQWGDAK